MKNKFDNTLLYAKSIPKTMPMLPADPDKARLELLVTYKGHKHGGNPPSPGSDRRVSSSRSQVLHE